MTNTFKAHGLDGSLVEPDWAPLTIAELRPLLAEYPQVGEPVAIEFASPRPFSAAGVVRTANGTVFVKRHARSVRDREGLLEEHRFLAHLLERGASVPRVFASRNGETAVERDLWTYEVHELAAGADLYGEAISWMPFFCAAHARAAGEALARLHCIAEGFDAPRRKVQPLVASFTIFAADHPAAEMARYLAARPTLAHHAAAHRCAEQALELLQASHADLRQLLPHLAPLWTHNDLHGSNLLWSDRTEAAQATAIIDFGLADQTNAVHDLAHAFERSIIEWLALVQHPERPGEVPVHLIISTRCSRATNRCESFRPRRPLRCRRCWRSVTQSLRCLRLIIFSACFTRKSRRGPPTMAGSSVTRAGFNRRRVGACFMRCGAGPIRAGVTVYARIKQGRAHDSRPLCLSARPRHRTCRNDRDRARNLAFHQAPAHLLAGGAGRGLSLSRRLLPGAAFFRCTAAGFLCRLYIYGWWHWWRGIRAEGEVTVASLSVRGWIVGVAAGAAGAVLLGELMVRIGAALPHLDAALTSYSLVASWWQARKHIANWWLWIAVDAVYVGEYLYKGLQLTALLYSGLIVLAILGLRAWQRAPIEVEQCG